MTKGGAYREGSLIERGLINRERGLNRAFTVYTFIIHKQRRLSPVCLFKLMQTVQTLHHGFLEEPDPFERRAERRPSSDKHNKASDGAKFILPRRNRDQPERYPASDLEIKDANEVVTEAESASLAERITSSVEDREVDDVAVLRQSSDELRANQVGSIDRQGRGSEEKLHEGKIYKL